MDNTLKTPENSGKSAEIDGFDKVRAALLAQLLTIAAFDGWTSKSLEQAASDAGIDPAMRRAAFPAGIGDVLRYWSEAADAEMTAAMASPEFAGLKIRQKVAFAVRARLDTLRPHKEAARRAAALMALPVHGLLGARLAWKRRTRSGAGLATSRPISISTRNAAFLPACGRRLLRAGWGMTARMKRRQTPFSMRESTTSCRSKKQRRRCGTLILTRQDPSHGWRSCAIAPTVKAPKPTSSASIYNLTKLRNIFALRRRHNAS